VTGERQSRCRPIPCRSRHLLEARSLSARPGISTLTSLMSSAAGPEHSMDGMSERAEACVMTIKGRMLTTVKKEMVTLLMRMLTRMLTRMVTRMVMRMVMRMVIEKCGWRKDVDSPHICSCEAGVPPCARPAM
jgi:hypothetical protein